MLQIVSADYLFHAYADRPEGDLTRIRASLVSESALFQFAQEIDLGEYLRLGRGEERCGGRTRPSVVSDAFEAVIAALYLDGGMEVARNFILPFITEGKHAEADYKTRLQEIVQQNPEERLSYVVESESGPDHDKHFVVAVRFNSDRVARGEGRSKKAAEQHAELQFPVGNAVQREPVRSHGRAVADEHQLNEQDDEAGERRPVHHRDVQHPVHPPRRDVMTRHIEYGAAEEPSERADSHKGADAEYDAENIADGLPRRLAQGCKGERPAQTHHGQSDFHHDSSGDGNGAVGANESAGATPFAAYPPSRHDSLAAASRPPTSCRNRSSRSSPADTCSIVPAARTCPARRPTRTTWTGPAPRPPASCKHSMSAAATAM